MARPVTIFTGQWADLPMEEMCKTAKEMGYEGWRSPPGARSTWRRRRRTWGMCRS